MIEDVPERIFTGCFDVNGAKIHMGDRLRLMNKRSITKSEYWLPEYRVVFDPPSYTLEYISDVGGKDCGSYTFQLRNRMYKIIEEPHATTAAADQRRAVEAMREACAIAALKIANEWENYAPARAAAHRISAHRCAAAIRALPIEGEKT